MGALFGPEHHHDYETCESCSEFWIGAQAKDTDSDADSGYHSGTTPKVEKERVEVPLVIPTIVVTPLTDSELRQHNACLRDLAALRAALLSPWASSGPPAYSSPYNSTAQSRPGTPSSICSSTSTSLSSSRPDSIFSAQPHLRPPEESYTRRLKDTWENRLAWPHFFPPPQIYSSRMNASLPSLLPSSHLPSSAASLGCKFLKGEMVPLSPTILRKRTSRDSVDSVRSMTLRRDNHLVATSAPTSIFKPPASACVTPRPPLSSQPTAKPSTPTISSESILNTNASPTLGVVGTRRPTTTTTAAAARKRWSIAGAGVGLSSKDTEAFKSTDSSPPPSNHAKTTPADASSHSKENLSLSSSALNRPPLRGTRDLSRLRESNSSKSSLKNDSSDSLSSVGSTTSTGTTKLGKSNAANKGGFRKGWGRFMGLYSTAPSSFKML